MHWSLILIIACLALAALKLALTVLIMVLAILIVWGAYSKPAEMFGLLAFGLLGAVLTKHPFATIGLAAFVVFVAWMKSPSTPVQPPLLPPPRRVDQEEHSGH
ncbi:MAG TPA: hypothetical protein VF655_13780 [Allosphingosinicella sp.]|jgi:hypothetical protein